MILPLFYFPPIPWFVALLQAKEVRLEVWQHYRKQQFTSRTHIKVANRILPLTIPIERRGAKVPLKEKKISYAENWQHQHWQSLVSAYRNSPYFDYYVDSLEPWFGKKPAFLVDLLGEILEGICRELDIPQKLTFTQNYLETYQSVEDFREAFDPTLKTLPDWFAPIVYPQVFGDFHPGLSILDLIFNMGPESKQILLQSWREPTK